MAGCLSSEDDQHGAREAHGHQGCACAQPPSATAEPSKGQEGGLKAFKALLSH